MDINTWEAGKENEIGFWESWLKRKSSPYQIPKRLSNTFDFMFGDKKEITIANLGAGAMNLIGDSRRDVEVKIVASDILADEFKKLREELGVTAPNPVEKQDMTNLTYSDNSFDIVYCANALDHSQDPYKALQEMVRIVKPGGWIYLKHMAHEGRRQGYHGLHQWNIDITEDGDCKFWNRSGAPNETFHLSDIYSEFKTEAYPMRKMTILTSYVQKCQEKSKINTLDYIAKKYKLNLANSSPIEIPNIGRNNLARLFAELGFGSGVEVGTEYGYFAKVLCLANSKLHLTCIDAWESYPDLSEYKPANKMNEAFVVAQKLLSPFGCKLIKAFSMDAVKSIPDESLDFVYIDANHKYNYVYEDITHWSKKVRNGGIIAGHDYFQPAGRSYIKNDTVKVLADYTKANNISPMFLIGAKWPKTPEEIRDKIRSWFYVKT